MQTNSVTNQDLSETANYQFDILPTDSLRPGQYQVRENFDSDLLVALANQIQEAKGLLLPIIVRPCDTGFEILAGERRWRAAQMAGLYQVPVRIISNCDDQLAAEIGLIENIQRQSLNAIEEAVGFNRLSQEFGLSHEQIAERLGTNGKSRTYVTSRLRLLQLPADICHCISRGQLTAKHGEQLLRVSAEQDQIELARMCIEKKWPVKTLSNHINELLSPTPKPGKNEDILTLEEKYSGLVRAPFSIKASDTGFTIQIKCKDQDQFEYALSQIGQ